MNVWANLASGVASGNGLSSAMPCPGSHRGSRGQIAAAGDGREMIDLSLIRYEASARGRWKSGNLAAFALVGDVTGFVTALDLEPIMRVRDLAFQKPARSTENHGTEPP